MALQLPLSHGIYSSWSKKFQWHEKLTNLIKTIHRNRRINAPIT